MKETTAASQGLTAPVKQQTHVLVVEDAPEFTQLVTAVLKADGYQVSSVGTGEAALTFLADQRPDLVVLDLVLPGIDGVEVCRQIRQFSSAYVIMLTSRADEVDLLVGLAVGADDYMTKPFSPRELLARVGTVLRRPRPEMVGAQQIRSYSDIEIDVLAREVRINGVEVVLTKIEFDLLDTLTSRPEMVFTRDLLLSRVWGATWYGRGHVVDVHIANLRKKIDLNGTGHLKTVRGIGYRMAPCSPN